jgi:UDP-N-acetylmuramoylalanine--D-glutamate ligase
METYRTALILGYGRSGKAAERLLRSEGCETTVFSQDTADDSALCGAMLKNTFDVCIVSPGFSLSHPWICLVSEAGIPLLSELELGWSRHRGKTVAVTGSNGKSTAVKWIAEMFQLAGHRVAIAGNYGIPACQAVMDHPDLDWLVLEVSSFQLETAQNFRADVAVLLNLLPNHMDRHESMDLYRRTKARIFGSISLSRDACVVPADWAELLKADVGSERLWITFGGTPDADYFFEKGSVFTREGTALDLTGTLFDSPVLGSCTGAAVAAVADQAGIPRELAEKAARSFKPLPHRLQKVGEIEGVAYVNDSKATNLAAVAAALQTCGSGVHLIAGGLPKESDYTFIKEVLAERAQSIYLTGQASRAMYQAWNGVCPCVECGTLEIAFNTARNAAKPGETVLLSPGCASFDQFNSFEERGERFIKLFQSGVQGGGDAR